ncbi:MAG: DEAD/DEAH box helicase, partial [Puniceicoccales bacterium]
IFTSDNFEFRLGVAIGAVVARAWSQGAEGPLATPTIDAWKATTGLPWFAFWAKELLRWGTLDPFVAFALSLGIAKSRPEAEAMRPRYIAWLDEELILWDGEDQIDPSNLLAWSKTLRVRQAPAPRRAPIPAALEGTDGRAGRYAVIPVRFGDRLRWLDASGFRLAVSEAPEGFPRVPLQSEDYDLVIENRNVSVVRQF